MGWMSVRTMVVNSDLKRITDRQKGWLNLECRNQFFSYTQGFEIIVN
jgi:hypothetical protein